MISALALSVGQPEQAIRAAQEAARDGYVSIERLFPPVKVPFAKENGALEHALVLALIRQESRFDRRARSGSGALGLMQLMPSTARSLARRMGLSESRKRLTRSPTHNVALGSRYLSDMIKRHSGSYLLAVAAYNGGPRNVARWIKANGDPRHDPDVDIIDWIEMIPLAETRNYVQRVLERDPGLPLAARPAADGIESGARPRARLVGADHGGPLRPHRQRRAACPRRLSRAVPVHSGGKSSSPPTGRVAARATGR